MKWFYCILFYTILQFIYTLTASDNICPNKLEITRREDWGADPPIEKTLLNLPVPYVIIAHANSKGCLCKKDCACFTRGVQQFHFLARNFSDIAYSFTIGSDGSVFEGRGWDLVSAVARGYNTLSITIGMIGTFNTELPPKRQMVALWELIEEGVRLGKIHHNYRLLAHRQVSASLSPGEALYQELLHWPHSVLNADECFY